jgi:hypothetical protein
LNGIVQQELTYGVGPCSERSIPRCHCLQIAKQERRFRRRQAGMAAIMPLR